MNENTENFEKTPLSPVEIPLRQTEEDRYIGHSGKTVSATPAVSAEIYPAEQGLSTRRFLSRFRILRGIPGILALAAAVLWPLVLLLDFDTDIGHIAKGSVLFVLLCVCLGLGCAAALALSFSAGRVRLYRYPKTGMSETFFGILTAALFGIRFVQDAYYLLFPKEITDIADLPVAGSALLPLLEKLAVWCSLFCVLYFLCIGLGKRGAVTALFGLGAALDMMLVLFRDYFDFTLPLNSPLRNMTLVLCVSVLLFLLAEVRMHVDLWYVEMPFALFADLLLILVGGGIGLGQCVLFFLDGAPMEISLLEQAAYVSMAGLALCRLHQYPSRIGDHVPPPPSKDDIKKEQKRRQKEASRH